MATVNEKMTAIADAIRDKTGGTEPLTLDDMAADIPKVYDAGKLAERTEFMTEYQRWNEYKGKYATSGWNDTTFFPVQDDIVKGSAYFMFGNDNITNIKKAYEDRGLTLDFSDCTDMQMCFVSCATTELGVIDMSKNTTSYGASECFAYNQQLRKIEKIISNPKIYWGSAFAGCTNLEEVIFEGEIGSARLNLSACTKLNASSILSVILCLSDTATGLTVTLPVSAKQTYYDAYGQNYTNADEAWAALITEKPNWTIALA